MECSRCRSANPPDARFCISCGAEIGTAGAAGEPSARTEVAGLGTFHGRTVAGKYRILGEIGSGGMGMVYKAEDTRLRRTVAIKFLSPDLTRGPEARERFIHEAQAASALDHTNICTIYEIDETDDGRMYIAMAYCEGETLSRKISRGRLSLREAISAAMQACEGLAHAHEAGIVHRDIKPANIIINERGRAKIVDFGLAKLAAATRLTRAGTTMGTVAYMSPEQALGESVDGRTDIWSVGVVLYEMVAGQTPFGGENEQAIIHSILHEPPRPVPPGVRVPADVKRIIDRCLSKNADGRYRKITDLVSDLKRLEQTLPRSADEVLPGRPSMIRLVAPRRRIIVPAVVAAAVIVLAVVPAARRAFESLLGTGPLPRHKYVAVLGLDAPGGIRDQALCDGLVHTLTGLLAQVRSTRDTLWVFPADDVRASHITDPQAAVSELGANLALTGTMVRQGDTIAVALNLLRPPATVPISAALIADPIANLSTWRDSVLARASTMLGLTPTPAAAREPAPITNVPGAYESYLIGRGFLYPFKVSRDVEAAKAAFVLAASEDPSFAMAYASLGECYWVAYELFGAKPEWLDSAASYCEKAVETDPQSPQVQLLLGRVRAARGEYDAALQAYHRAVELYPESWEAWVGIARVYGKAGKTDRAALAYAKATEISPLNYNLYNELGSLYFKQGQFEAAIEPYRRMVELRPSRTTGYTNLGSSYFELGVYDRAREMFERSLALKPDERAYSNLGTVLFFEARYADAARMYREAIGLSPGSYLLRGHYAEACYWQPGEKDSALANYAVAISLAEQEMIATPHNTSVLADLASYETMLGNRAKARAYLNEAAAARPTNPRDLFRIAETYEQLGQRDSAMVWVEKAVDSGYPVAMVGLYPGMSELHRDKRFQRLKREREAGVSKTRF